MALLKKLEFDFFTVLLSCQACAMLLLLCAFCACYWRSQDRMGFFVLCDPIALKQADLSHFHLFVMQ